jgi:hypothetical protein
VCCYEKPHTIFMIFFGRVLMPWNCCVFSGNKSVVSVRAQVYIFIYVVFAEYDYNAFYLLDIFCKISGPTYIDGYSCLFKPLVTPPHVYMVIVIYSSLYKTLIPPILYNIGGRVNSSPTPNFISRIDTLSRRLLSNVWKRKRFYYVNQLRCEERLPCGHAPRNMVKGLLQLSPVTTWLLAVATCSSRWAPTPQLEAVVAAASQQQQIVTTSLLPVHLPLPSPLLQSGPPREAWCYMPAWLHREVLVEIEEPRVSNFPTTTLTAATS